MKRPLRDRAMVEQHKCPHGAGAIRIVERRSMEKDGVDEKGWNMEVGMSWTDEEFFQAH